MPNEENNDGAQGGTEEHTDGQQEEQQAGSAGSDEQSSDNRTSGAGEPDIDWKAKAREWEKRAKTNQAEAKKNADAARRLAAIEDEKKTADEKAQERERKAAEREQAASERVAKADIRAALTGIVDDPDSIIEDLKISRFLTDDGEVDDDAIASLKAKYEALRPANVRAIKPNPAQGANGSKEHEKPYTKADLVHMTTDEINEARRAGKLDHLLGRRAALTK